MPNLLVIGVLWAIAATLFALAQRQRGGPRATAPDSWREVIWREWRNGDDRELVERLYALLAGEPVPREYWSSLALFGAACGIAFGSLIGVLIVATPPTELGTAHAASIVLPSVLATAWLCGLQVYGAVRKMTWATCIGVQTFAYSLLLLMLVLLLMTVVSLAVAAVALAIALLMAFLLVRLLASLTEESHTMNAALVARAYSPLVRAFGLVHSLHLSLRRPLCFWWSSRPSVLQLWEALRQASAAGVAAQPDWEQCFSRTNENACSGEVAALVASLQADDWVERFAARTALALRSGESVLALAAAAGGPHSSLRTQARWVLRTIGEDTSSRLGDRAKTLWCPTCLVRCHKNRLPIPRLPALYYYGCRQCGQSRGLVERPGEVVAVLDETMAPGEVEDGGFLRANWLDRR